MPKRTYHGYALDPFQKEALAAVDAGKSVIVAAPTGTGKTLVADYLVEKAIHAGERVIYTAPIKALSNQKYKDFRNQFGDSKVGILTGDVVLNPAAPLLIMTTEIFRNQVITEDANLGNVSHVIFDEIHWLNDEERGTVWEESIILAPPHVKILGLSATIANARELVDWIASIRHEELALVEEHKRVVPLEYYYFTKDTGLATYDQLWRYYRQKSHEIRYDEESPFSTTTHLDLIRAIQRNYLPALYFVFSRKQCVGKARELAGIANYLKPAQKRQVEAAFFEQFGPEEDWSASTRQLKRLSVKGIAFHHAGLLPGQKVLVEELFQRRLIHVLYCTETFSVGINYPVKSVCFDSLHKFDGRSFRPLANHEFFQMSGRAGRRGIDEVGYSFALVDFNYMEKNPPQKFQLNQLEPLSSQFRLTYNTVLNLTATLNAEQIETYFKKSFSAYHAHLKALNFQAELEEAEAALQAVEHICEHLGSYHCPLKYYPKHKDLERLRRAYQALGPRKQNRVYGREMARKLKSWEKLVAHPPKACPQPHQSLCREQEKAYLRNQQRIKELQKSLSALPDENLFLKEFERRKEQLRQMGYMRGDELLPRGICASHIYVQELFVTELIFSDILQYLDDDGLNALLSGVDFEARKNDYFQKHAVIDLDPVYDIIHYIQGVCGKEAVLYEPRVAGIASAWSKGDSFEAVQHLCNLDEGDIISVFRRTIDLLRQMRDAIEDQALRSRLKVCIEKLDRDEAAVVEIQ
ncbi:MAG: DEAD/DEAH box helicase [Desulfitobacteriaceae bacterium]|nr:DEAD/DEAH box helicase [Desulfitobacteriaceae bacterium]MDI6879953.1 DEAD/DEAH box helicase [Desulfitobacteriaceae bacterium]MDI6916060.1 DEAD/DEAH box helicase [Desulfitobacteriaceae bacterium]